MMRKKMIDAIKEHARGHIEKHKMNTNFRTPGTVIAFKSYLPHEVTPVTKGERITLTYFIRGPKSR